MKKVSCLAFLLLAAAYSVSAQLYFKVGFGYAIADAGQSMYDTPIPYNGFPTGINGSRNNTSANSYTYNIKGASYSSGFQTDLGFGYMFSQNVGVQLDAAIGLANTKYTFDDNNANLGTTASPLAGTITTIQHAKTPTFLMPALVLQTGGDKLNLYTRFGLALPLNAKVTQEQIISNAPGTGTQQVDDFTWQIKSSFSLGFTAAAGVKYKISDRVSVWGELSLLSISMYTKQQDLKTWNEDGQSVALNNYPYPTSIKFSKTANVDSTLSTVPTYSQPFSNIGVNVGLSFNFGKSRGGHTSRRSNSDDALDDKPFRRR